MRGATSQHRPTRRAAPRSVRIDDASTAGITPAITMATAPAAIAAIRTRPSRPTSSRNGVPGGAIATSARMPTTARATPTALLRTVRTALSTRSCWTSRARLAPSERRIASSRARARAANEREVGDVRAGDEQHAGHGRQQRVERQRHVGVDDVLAQRHERGRPSGTLPRVVARDPGGYGGQAGTRLIRRGPVREPGQRVEDHVVAARGDVGAEIRPC